MISNEDNSFYFASVTCMHTDIKWLLQDPGAWLINSKFRWVLALLEKAYVFGNCYLSRGGHISELGYFCHLSGNHTEFFTLWQSNNLTGPKSRKNTNITNVLPLTSTNSTLQMCNVLAIISIKKWGWQGAEKCLTSRSYVRRYQKMNRGIYIIYFIYISISI